MKDYSEIISTLRMANSCPSSPGYVAAMLAAADAIEELQKEYDVLAKMYDKANADLTGARGTIDFTVNLALRDHEAYHKKLASRDEEIEGLLKDRRVLRGERDAAVEDLKEIHACRNCVHFNLETFSCDDRLRCLFGGCWVWKGPVERQPRSQTPEVKE